MMMIDFDLGPRLVRQHVRKMRICGEIIYNHKARDSTRFVVVCCHGCRCEAIAQGGDTTLDWMVNAIQSKERSGSRVGYGKLLDDVENDYDDNPAALFPSNVCCVVCFCC